MNGTALPDLYPVSIPGVETARDSFLIGIDLQRLKKRVADYFNAVLSHEEIARRHPGAMTNISGFDARSVRNARLAQSSKVRASYAMLTDPSTSMALLGIEGWIAETPCR